MEKTDYIVALKRIIDLQNRLMAHDMRLDHVMDVIVQGLPSLIAQAAGAAVGVLEGDTIVWRAASGIATPVIGLRHLPAGTLSGAAIALKAIQYSTDTEHDERVAPSAADELGVRAMVSCPLVSNDRTIGVLDVVFTSPRSFEGFELEILSTAASVIAASMKHAISIESVLDDSLHDHMTGLGNRRAYDRVLPRLVAQGHHHRQPLALVVLDLDELKRINDEHGHAAGDDVIRTFAKAIEATTRSTDHAFRFGGDEFAVILTDCDDMCSKRFLSRLGDALCTMPGRLIRYSTGVAHLTTTDNAATLARRADAAMYERKRSRKTAVQGEVRVASAVRSASPVEESAS